MRSMNRKLLFLQNVKVQPTVLTSDSIAHWVVYGMSTFKNISIDVDLNNLADNFIELHFTKHLIQNNVCIFQ